MFKNLSDIASKTAAAAQQTAVTASSAVAAKIPLADECPSCHKTISQARVITGIGALTPCVSCGVRVCKDCCRKSAEPLAEYFAWHPSTQKSKDGYGLLCLRTCYPQCVVIWMAQLVEKHNTASVAVMNSYMSSRLGSVPPKPLAEDTQSRKALRLFHIAGYAADVVGYSTFFKAIKLAAAGTGVMGLVLQGDVAKLLYPLMECLKEFGIEGPNGVLRVYYLGCHYELQRKLDHTAEFLGHSVGSPGVLSENCPVELLDYVGRYSGPAQWLYSAKLPDPHSGALWTEWYLSRIAQSQGWTLLYSVVDSTTLYNGTACPAFALVARDDAMGKQAMLVIRGTQTSVDWKINLAETMYRFSYRGGPRGERVVNGNVHTGMMLGALGILDVYCMRQALHCLIDNGFDVKIVGHSLGSGTACLLTIELKNGLYLRAVNASPTREVIVDLPRVTAVGYGTPPVVDEDIGDAIIADELMVSVIHRDDVVPRLSRFNIESLAKEVHAITPIADKWKAEDTASFKKYAATYGQAGDMSDHKPTSSDMSEEMSKEESSVAIVEEDPPQAVPVEMSNHIVEQSELLVVPGVIIHLTMVHAQYKATLCDHRLPALRSIAPLTHGVHDHKMASHISALRSLKILQGITPRVAPAWQPVRDPSGGWTKCYVCDCDTTWAHITKSDATRSLVSHNCRACGRVVCSMCGPKGDTVAGDGVGKMETLPDYSLSLPSIGLVTQERVCIPCYLHSYQL